MTVRLELTGPERRLLEALPIAVLAESLLKRLQADSAVQLLAGEVELHVRFRDGRYQRGRAELAFGQLRRE